MSRGLQWDISDKDGVTRIVLRGPVDEDADFAALSRDVEGRERLTLDLSEVERINSCGVREWVNFIRGVPAGLSVEFARCSPAIVSQINMISNFVGDAKVVSVQAPYACDNCGHESTVEFDVVGQERPVLGDVDCAKCGSAMEFDDIEDSYFAFLL